MVLQLSFDEGTFAGKTIRTTDDHHASAYDIMRVAGVGRDECGVRANSYRDEEGHPAIVVV